jgi:soluble lytic murein transglycosylase
MSARPAPARPAPAAGRPAAASPRSAPRRTVVRRRRAVLALGAALIAALTALAVAPLFRDAVRELKLPLRHEDIIRQQASEKGVDPALVAAVIYTESKFRDQTSVAGARGLMQITPATARHIARRSGGTRFVVGDLATPQVNIAYGTWYLHYLLADRYRGDEVLALAAYNAGEANVDRWVAAERARGDRFHPTQSIPFPETRAYVTKVLDARRQYRRTYARELGLR